ncbi:MAG: hypothetical protein AAB587_00895 [Patescibacteria group bacterium]
MPHVKIRLEIPKGKSNPYKKHNWNKKQRTASSISFYNFIQRGYSEKELIRARRKTETDPDIVHRAWWGGGGPDDGLELRVHTKRFWFGRLRIVHRIIFGEERPFVEAFYILSKGRDPLEFQDGCLSGRIFF